jgi:DNA-directed DNA polymerase III PolC
LHNHTSASTFDGCQTPETFVRRLDELNLPGAAITDHGVLYAWPEFQETCEAEGLKPVLGVESYFVEDFDRVQKLREKGGAARTDREDAICSTRFHQVLLAKTQTGLQNLMALASWAGDEGFYHQPTIDFRQLKTHAEGLIATSSCVQGLIPQIALGNPPFAGLSKAERARKLCAVTETYLDLFGADFYLEAHRHGIEDEEQMNRAVRWLSDRYDLPVITANDCHYARESDYELQDAKVRVSMSDPGDPFYIDEGESYAHRELHVKSAQEMIDLFPEFPEAAENTLDVFDQCNARLPLGEGDYFFPEYPQLNPDETAYERLIRECADRFLQRYPNPTPEHKERMRYELQVIEEMGFSNYFLIVADIVRAARAQGIDVGPGRGSAAGSMVTYVLGITGLDPLKHDLLFDRFLNPERVTMPDIDIDFDDTRREEVFQYIYDRYGEDRVAKVITFSTYKTKGTLKDVGKIFHYEPAELNALTKKIPDEVDTDPMDEVLDASDELRQKARRDDRFAQVCRIAENLYGMESHTGIHAAAVVITPGPLNDYLPTERDRSSDEIKTQFDGDQLEDIGLLKMDILGLKTLREIRTAIEFIEARTGEPFDESVLEARDDEAVYTDVFGEGDTKGIFQFESGGMREYLSAMTPTEFDHITAMNALYRPGPMKLIPDFIERMHGEQEVQYLHEDVHDAVKNEVDDILDDTYGIMVFQEQIMQVCRRLAGFSLGEADIMRRAVGKKKEKLLQQQKEKFVTGCQEEGYTEALGDTIFDLIEEFADYGFNKCVTGDTTLWGNSETVGEMCEALQVGERHDTTAYSMNDRGEIVENEVLIVAPQGEQPVYEITVEGIGLNGEGKHRTIRATANHKFPVKDASAGANGYVEKRVDKIIESDVLFVSPEGVEGVGVLIDSIKFVGTEEVYDVTMAGEPHNFVTGEGIVTCNSHAAAYSAIAYQQAYLKKYHPTAFFASVIRAEDDDDEQAALIQDAKKHGIEVRPPSINRSGRKFTPVEGETAIQFGLGTLKHVGKEAQSILEERQKGPFQSYEDFVLRAIPNKSALRSLIKAGALDAFEKTRAAMFEAMEDLLTYARKMRDYRRGDRKSKPDQPAVRNVAEWPPKMRFRQERDVAGIYTSGQPIDRFPALTSGFDDREYRRPSRRYGDADFRLRCGAILSISEAKTKNDNPMWWVRYLTADGVLEEPVFAFRHEHIAERLEPDVPSLVISKADVTGEYAGKYSIQNVIPMRRLPKEWAQVMHIQLDPGADRADVEALTADLPDGDTQIWAKPVSGQNTDFEFGHGIELDPSTIREARRLGTVRVY